jgi:hypothetical protein
VLIPNGLSDAQDESDVGTCSEIVCSRAYFVLYANAICPIASVTMSGFSLTMPTEDPVREPDERADTERDEDADRQTVAGADAHADEQVPAERDDAGRSTGRCPPA